MKSSDVRSRYITYFIKQKHKEIPSARLIPENDPTTLFTSSGMQPLVPYLLGQPHPLGKRLVNSQKSFRAGDIDEVGDNRHTTFFEMLGNWSLGEYFKKEQLPWIFEFLTKELNLDPYKLYVSVFEGNASVPKDTESITIWKNIFKGVGIDAEVAEPHFAKASRGARIFLYDARKNWWSRSGEPDKMPAGEPGGPDSEVFYDFGEEFGLHEKSAYKNQKCHPNCDCGRFMEIANSVFMQYQKQKDGSLKELAQKNVDFGGGLERMVAATENSPDIFTTDLFAPVIQILETASGKTYGKNEDETKAMRIITDHAKASVMMMADGVLPSNKAQGYILRRLIRRSLLYGRRLGLITDLSYIGQLVKPIAAMYVDQYSNVREQEKEIKHLLEEEALRFGRTLERGIKEMDKLAVIDGKIAFTLYETYGFPWEMTVEIATEKGQTVDRAQFEEEFKKHQEQSRSAAKGMFKGGLADHSEQTTKLHTATHLLHKALQMTLGDHVGQKGSNITVERLRFDFSHPQKVTPEELKKVEEIVNEQIKKDIPVSFTVSTYEEAVKNGATAFFGERYPEKVKVYSIGNPSTHSTGSGQAGSGPPFSREICGGPHVEHIGTLGSFKIIKEESAGAGIRRIYAVVEK
jgi:alanyl-tRNA synthetase